MAIGMNNRINKQHSKVETIQYRNQQDNLSKAKKYYNDSCSI